MMTVFELESRKPGMKVPGVASLQSHASGGRIHVCLEGIRVVWESRTVRFRSENPQGFGGIKIISKTL